MLDVTAQPRENLRPALMRLQAFRRETRMRQANGCEPVLFRQIETHKRFRWILLPVWQPGEGKHVGRLDRSIFSFYGERPAEAGAAHPPFATNPQIGLNVRGLKTAFRAPPLLALRIPTKSPRHSEMMSPGVPR